MSDPDDRGEALAWYFRLLVKQELERGATRKSLYERMGIERGHLSQIERGKLGIGVPKLIPFAEALGRKPGELLDEALAWWPTHGKRYREQALAEMHGTKTPHESGEHPSQSPLKAAR